MRSSRGCPGYLQSKTEVWCKVRWVIYYPSVSDGVRYVSMVAISLVPRPLPWGEGPGDEAVGSYDSSGPCWTLGQPDILCFMHFRSFRGVNSDSGVSVEYRLLYGSPGRRCGLHPCTQLWVPRWQLQLEGYLHLHSKQTQCPWQWHHGT